MKPDYSHQFYTVLHYSHRYSPRVTPSRTPVPRRLMLTFLLKTGENIAHFGNIGWECQAPERVAGSQDQGTGPLNLTKTGRNSAQNLTKRAETVLKPTETGLKQAQTPRKQA